MVKVNILWTSTAISQRNTIFEYWNDRNGSTTYSKKLNFMIKERLLHLSNNPLMGKISVLENTRTISLGHFSIIYKLQDNLIFIMAFWDNRQDPEILLSNLKK